MELRVTREDENHRTSHVAVAEKATKAFFSILSVEYGLVPHPFIVGSDRNQEQREQTHVLVLHLVGSLLEDGFHGRSENDGERPPAARVLGGRDPLAAIDEIGIEGYGPGVDPESRPEFGEIVGCQFVEHKSPTA